MHPRTTIRFPGLPILRRLRARTVLVPALALVGVAGCGGEPPAPPQRLGVSGPAAFQGVLPCPDCPGIRTTFVLRDDGTYLLERIHPGIDGAPDRRVAEIGTWRGSIPDQRIDLRGPDQGSPAWLVVAPDTLMLLEQARRRARPEQLPLLLRIPIPQDAGESYLVEGLYRWTAGGETLMPCPGPVAYPVPADGGGLALRAAALEGGVPEGEGWLVRVRGWLVGDSLRVEGVEATGAGSTCPGEPFQEEVPGEAGDAAWAEEVASRSAELPIVEYEVMRGDVTSRVRARIEADAGDGAPIPVLVEETMDLGDYGESRVTYYFLEGTLLRLEETGERRLMDPRDPSRPVPISLLVRFGPDGALREAVRTLDGSPARVPPDEIDGIRAHWALLRAALQATRAQGSRDGMGAPAPDSSSEGDRS
jgi:copper homeostasis protein (lipoprotein)